MSGSSRELKRRIKSIGSTEQMTVAMKTVAVSKYNRARTRMDSFVPYGTQCERFLASLGGVARTKEAGDNGKVCYVIMTANRGLCGSFNIDLVHRLKEVLAGEKREAFVVSCGKWSADNLAGGFKQKIVKNFEISDIPEYGEAVQVAEYLRNLYQNGEADEIYVVYQSFKNLLTQTPSVKRFLPFEQEGEEKPVEYLFEPDRETIIGLLTERCLTASVYKSLLITASGAHGAMLMAMRTAADNSAEMRAQLELALNRKRQSAVTTEVLELSGGIQNE